MQIHLIDMADRLLNTMSPQASQSAERFFREHTYGLATQNFGQWFSEQLVMLGVQLVVTSLVALALVAAARLAHRIGSERTAGVLAGAQTQPAVLAFANERTGFDNRVALGYALVYPAAMIAKILLAQVLAGR